MIYYYFVIFISLFFICFLKKEKIEIKKLISVGAHDIEIEDAAVACGMKTLNQSCFHHILRGETTIEEFVRVLGLVSE